MFGCLDDVVCVFTLLDLLMMYEPCVCGKVFVVNNIVPNNVCGYHCW